MKFKSLMLILIILLTSVFLIQCKKTDTTESAELKKTEAVIIQLVGVVLTAKDIKIPIEKWEPVKMREVISEGIFIRTRTNSSCDILLKNGSVVKLIDNTIIYVGKLIGDDKITQSDFKLEGGSVFAKASRLVGDSTFSISTPTAVAGVRGTEFVVEHNEGKTNIAVSQGKVAVTRNIEIDASKPITPQTEQASNALREPVEITQGQAIDVTQEQNREIEQTFQQTQQGQSVEIEKIRTRSRLTSRQANQTERNNFIRFRDLRNIPSEERDTFGVLLIFGGTGTNIFIDNELIGNDMLMRVTKIGKYKIKIVKNGNILKEETVEIKSKQKTVVKIAEPAFTAPERTEEKRRIQKARDRVFGDDRPRRRNIFEERPRRRVFDDSTGRQGRGNDVFQDGQNQSQEQRNAVQRPGSTNYGTERNTMDRLRQRRENIQQRRSENIRPQRRIQRQRGASDLQGSVNQDLEASDNQNSK